MLNLKKSSPLNENVLIEIGAAMALYGERYILLVESRREAALEFARTV